MKFQTRKQLIEKTKKDLEVYIERRGMKLVQIATSSKNDRIRKKAKKWIDGIQAVGFKAMCSMMFISVYMTDKQIRDMVWKEQRSVLDLCRQHNLRIKGMTGALSMDKQIGAGPAMAKLNELREKNKAIA
ncbi:hypothetical protein [Pseudomonas phage D6]|nr:hypothetical protein [Pseudomonas phage D6]